MHYMRDNLRRRVKAMRSVATSKWKIANKILDICAAVKMARLVRMWFGQELFFIKIYCVCMEAILSYFETQQSFSSSMPGVM
jgi:hypothetical protein